MMGAREGACLEEGKLYQARAKRDPFVPLVASGMKPNAGGLMAVESPEQIQLEGIVTDPDPKKSIVVANGSVLKMNEEVGPVKVLKIEPGGVLFSINGMEAFKPLYQEETKK